MIFTIDKALRWRQLNEYEGELHGTIDDLSICVHLLVCDPEKEWPILLNSDSIELDIWLERSGSILKLNPSSKVNWEQCEGPSYRIQSRILEIVDEETFHVEGLFPLRIDIDGALEFELSVGDFVVIEGVLKGELP